MTRTRRTYDEIVICHLNMKLTQNNSSSILPIHIILLFRWTIATKNIFLPLQTLLFPTFIFHWQHDYTTWQSLREIRCVNTIIFVHCSHFSGVNITIVFLNNAIISIFRVTHVLFLVFFLCLNSPALFMVFFLFICIDNELANRRKILVPYFFRNSTNIVCDYTQTDAHLELFSVLFTD